MTQSRKCVSKVEKPNGSWLTYCWMLVSGDHAELGHCLYLLLLHLIDPPQNGSLVQMRNNLSLPHRYSLYYPINWIPMMEAHVCMEWPLWLIFLIFLCTHETRWVLKVTVLEIHLTMSHFAYACKMRYPLNLVLESWEYLSFYWTFCIVILDYGLKLHKLSNHTLVMLQKWLEIH